MKFSLRISSLFVQWTFAAISSCSHRVWCDIILLWGWTDKGISKSHKKYRCPKIYLKLGKVCISRWEYTYQLSTYWSDSFIQWNDKGKLRWTKSKTLQQPKNQKFNNTSSWPSFVWTNSLSDEWITNRSTGWIVRR